MNIIDITGASGVFLILLAYFLLITKRLHKESMIYLLMNTVGAGLACIASILLHYWPFIILEGAWTVVSVYGIYAVSLSA
jgi:O-antigen/teichoic acid export membrane protein